MLLAYARIVGAWPTGTRRLMDYSVLAFWFGVDILAYLALLKLQPGAARVWFCLAGALVGLYIALFFGMFLILTFITDGWNRLGAAIWLGPIFAISGGAAGYWLVHWWTEPPQVRP